MDETALTPGSSDDDNLTISTTDSSAQSAAIGTAGSDYVVRVFATKACGIRIGDDPVAVATDCPLADNDRDVFVIPGGQKIAAIRSSENGTLSITIMH
jgi:hypothetical protein